MSPLLAYDLAEQQRRRAGEMFRARIVRMHCALVRRWPDLGQIPSSLPKHLRPVWRDARHAFAETKTNDPGEIAAAYRAVVVRFGLKLIDPKSRDFEPQLHAFYRNYVTNFPLPEEQESRQGFRDLWKASPREGGYEELGYSVFCPLTGRYIMGVNFTIQARSGSVHFIYGFVNPIARVLGGFSAQLIELMRAAARQSIAEHFQRHPEDRPAWHTGGDPVILFEKNKIDEMSLAEILMDSAGVDVDRPPQHGARLASSGTSQSMRDFIWDRRGARVIDFNYLQSSLDGVVRVPEAARVLVTAWLNRQPLDEPDRIRAEQTLNACLGGKVPGCLTLNLCAFADPGQASLPVAQVRRAIEIFTGISVVKDLDHVAEDIYFQAQMASLSERARNGSIALLPITACGPASDDFLAAEQTTRRLLSGLTWAELREGRDRTYGEWLQQRMHGQNDATCSPR